MDLRHVVIDWINNGAKMSSIHEDTREQAKYHQLFLSAKQKKEREMINNCKENCLKKAKEFFK